jgi:hypothetical protein
VPEQLQADVSNGDGHRTEHLRLVCFTSDLPAHDHIVGEAVGAVTAPQSGWDLIMSASAQRCCLWCGIILMTLFGLGFGALAGFIVPPSPQASPVAIAQMFAAKRTEIRFGLLISMVAAGLLVPWSAGLFIPLRRIEGRFSPWPYVVMLSGTLFSLEFLYLLFFWLVCAYREDAAPEFVRNLNDMAWVAFVGLVSTAVIFAAAMGISTLSDRRSEPLLPRWFGYFSLWAALMFTPGSANVFFKDGPLAYNGIFAWYIPVAVFGIWVPVVTVVMLKSVTRQEREWNAAPPPRGVGGGPLEVEDLAAQLADLRRELAELRPAATSR